MICQMCNEQEARPDEKYCLTCRQKALLRLLNMGLMPMMKPNVAGGGIQGHAAAHSQSRSERSRGD